MTERNKFPIGNDLWKKGTGDHTHFKRALIMEEKCLAAGQINKYPRGSWRKMAQTMLLLGGDGDSTMMGMAIDRADGRVPVAVGGAAELGPIVIGWKGDAQNDVLPDIEPDTPLIIEGEATKEHE